MHAVEEGYDFRHQYAKYEDNICSSKVIVQQNRTVQIWMVRGSYNRFPLLYLLAFSAFCFCTGNNPWVIFREYLASFLRHYCPPHHLLRFEPHREEIMRSWV